MSEQLLREWIRQNLLLETSALTGGQMSNRPWRFEKFLALMNASPPGEFEIEAAHIAKYGGTTSVTIPVRGNDDLIAALRAKDKEAYNQAFKAGVKAFDGSNPITLKAAGHLNKSADFGGRGGTPASIQNEIDFEAAINQYASQSSPINVVIGKYQISGVMGAKQAGSDKVSVIGFDKDGNEVTSKETSKSDVNLFKKDGSTYPVSIKMPSAAYWLSGDSKLRLMDKFDRTLEILENQPAPDPRIVLDVDGKNYIMVTGPDENPKNVSLSFSLPNSVAMDAVFGTDQNPVNIVAKGDFISAPSWDHNTSTLSWVNAKVFERSAGIEGLPLVEKPMGLLRKGEMKQGGVRRGTKGYPGIRPAVASEARTKSTINIDALVAFQGADITAEVRVLIRSVIRESFLLTEALSKSDKKDIERMIRKQIQASERSDRDVKKLAEKVAADAIKDALGVSYFGTPGKINKFVLKSIHEEVNDWLGDKKTQNEIADITKAVVKKLYRELSFASPQIIDRIKV